jgi:hypothetical protein
MISSAVRCGSMPAKSPSRTPSVRHPVRTLKGGNIFPGHSRHPAQTAVAASLLPGKHLPVATRSLRAP